MSCLPSYGRDWLEVHSVSLSFIPENTGRLHVPAFLVTGLGHEWQPKEYNMYYKG